MSPSRSFRCLLAAFIFVVTGSVCYSRDAWNSYDFIDGFRLSCRDPFDIEILDEDETQFQIVHPESPSVKGAMLYVEGGDVEDFRDYVMIVARHLILAGDYESDTEYISLTADFSFTADGYWISIEMGESWGGVFLFDMRQSPGNAVALMLYVDPSDRDFWEQLIQDALDNFQIEFLKAAG